MVSVHQPIQSPPESRVVGGTGEVFPVPLPLKNKKLSVSPEMISAGVQVLHESGVLFAESSADYLVVRRILETALAVQKNEQQS